MGKVNKSGNEIEEWQKIRRRRRVRGPAGGEELVFYFTGSTWNVARTIESFPPVRERRKYSEPSSVAPIREPSLVVGTRFEMAFSDAS
jgi:hypothetical protein